MAAESIITYKKLAHPAYRVSDKSVRTDIEYVGPFSTLNETLSAELKRGLAWGDYPGRVTDIDIKGIEGTDLGELTVGVELEIPSDGDFGFDGGVATGIAYEIDWVVVGRPLLEHPEFFGGNYNLSTEDRIKVAEWEDEKTDAKYQALPAFGQKYAEGVMIGISSWDDFAPVLTKTTSYVGGPGPTSSAGAKESPPEGFPNKPTGYEWVKSADRSLRSGSRDKWDRTEQWTGAKKVMVDKTSLYY